MQSSPGPKGASLLPALTGARFFAAMSVVFYHYGMGPLNDVAPFLGAAMGAGPAAVSFFYVLSGAVITWSATSAEGVPTRTRRVFWGGRAARILPAYLVALLLTVLPFAAHSLKIAPGAGGVARVVAGFFSCLFLVQAFVPQLAIGLNSPGWSVSCEAFFYSLWPRLVVALRSQRSGFPWGRVLALWGVSLLAPVFGLVLLASGIVPNGPFATISDAVSGGDLVVRVISYFPPIRLCEFAIGIALGHAMRHTPARPRSFAVESGRELLLIAVGYVVLRALCSGIATRVTGVPLATRISVESGVLSPLFAVAVWQLSQNDGIVGRLLSTRPCQVLGEASYALYVMQEPVLIWTTALLKRVRPALLAHDDLIFWGYAGILVAVALLVHRVIEVPLRLRLQAVLAPRVIPGTGDGLRRPLPSSGRPS